MNNRYQIQAVLGEGAMGAVYLALDRSLGTKKVAIKEMVLPAARPEDRMRAVAQFRREATLLGSLEHPGLVQVTEFFETGASAYLVMTYIQGHTLAAVTEQRPVALHEVVKWAIEIAGVLEYLHGQSPPILFRDMKPSNVMLDKNGRTRLIDFGIARTLEAGQDTATLLKGAGTAEYAPLEQVGGRGTDVRSDVYSLGATLYRLATGERPPVAVDVMTGSSPPANPWRMHPDIPPSLDTVIVKAMALRKEDRYPTVRAMRAELERIPPTDLGAFARPPGTKRAGGRVGTSAPGPGPTPGPSTSSSTPTVLAPPGNPPGPRSTGAPGGHGSAGAFASPHSPPPPASFAPSGDPYAPAGYPAPGSHPQPGDPYAPAGYPAPGAYPQPADPYAPAGCPAPGSHPQPGDPYAPAGYPAPGSHPQPGDPYAPAGYPAPGAYPQPADPYAPAGYPGPDGPAPGLPYIPAPCPLPPRRSADPIGTLLAVVLVLAAALVIAGLGSVKKARSSTAGTTPTPVVASPEAVPGSPGPIPASAAPVPPTAVPQGSPTVAGKLRKAPVDLVALEIDSRPRGAHVVVDDSMVMDGAEPRTTPMSVPLEPGPHEVQVTAPGHEPFKTRVRVRKGPSRKLFARLMPALSRPGTRPAPSTPTAPPEAPESGPAPGDE